MSAPTWNQYQPYVIGEVVYYTSSTSPPALWTYTSATPSIVGAVPSAVNSWAYASLPSQGIVSIGTSSGWGTTTSTTGSTTTIKQNPMTTTTPISWIASTLGNTNTGYTPLGNTTITYGAIGTIFTGNLGITVNYPYSYTSTTVLMIRVQIDTYIPFPYGGSMTSASLSIPAGTNFSVGTIYYNLPYTLVIGASFKSQSEPQTTALGVSNTPLPASMTISVSAGSMTVIAIN